MMPYELIIPSAARPHLLATVLQTLFARVDQFPTIVRIHNDERWPGRRAAIDDLPRLIPETVPIVIEHDDPPIRHGPAIHRLLSQVQTEYVLYSQDDHRVVRPVPIRRALSLMHQYHLNQIRFNKRDTMDKKGPEGQEFFKVEHEFTLNGQQFVMCGGDHWVFQTSLWRVAAIKPVVEWWADPREGGRLGAFSEHCEVKINDVFNGKFLALKRFPPPVPQCPDPALWNEPAIRATVHKTFIWGKIGEPAFVTHIGNNPEDWALERANRDPLRGADVH